MDIAYVLSGARSKSKVRTMTSATVAYGLRRPLLELRANVSEYKHGRYWRVGFVAGRSLVVRTGVEAGCSRAQKHGRSAMDRQRQRARAEAAMLLGLNVLVLGCLWARRSAAGAR